MKKNDKKIYLISNGDFRDAVGVACWPKQEETLKRTQRALRKLGFKTQVIPHYDGKRKHGFLTRQSEGALAFSKIDTPCPYHCGAKSLGLFPPCIWPFSDS